MPYSIPSFITGPFAEVIDLLMEDEEGAVDDDEITAEEYEIIGAAAKSLDATHVLNESFNNLSVHDMHGKVCFSFIVPEYVSQHLSKSLST